MPNSDLLTKRRVGCCADWPKPCSYHEGFEDALQDPQLRTLLEEAGRIMGPYYSDHYSGSDACWVFVESAEEEHHDSAGEV